MADAIDNLAQDLNQANPSGNQGKMYLVGDQYLPFGALVPNMAGVRVGDKYVNDIGDSWNWDINDYDYAPSTLGTGEGIDYNVRDKPVERINIKSGDEQDALIRTGIGTPLDPKTENIYGVKGLVPPDKAGGFVGVDYLTPKQIEDLTAGQTPSVPQGVVTRGEPVSIPGKGLPNYRQIINDDGSISYLNEDTRKIDFTVPGVKGSPGVADLSGNPDLKLPSTLTKGTGTSVGSTPVTPSPVGAYEGVGADQPTTASVGGFDNTGGNLTVGPGGTTNVTPGYVPKPEPKPGDEFKDSPYKIFDPTVKINPDYINPVTGEEFPPDQNGNRWNFTKGDWDYADPTKVITPVKDTTKPPVVNPPGGGTTTTPPGGGTTTTPPGGGVRPGTGTYTGTPLPPREPVTPLVRRETVIPTKGTKEVSLPDRQADPFAKLYADLLANSQQQQDKYRYINYDPDQIMNAAMSGFRRRGAMRSLQGY